MSRFVLDNSIVMAWCFEDEESPYAQAVLASLDTNTALAPSIWPLEVANVLVVAERRKRLHGRDTAKFLSLLNNLPIIVEPEDTERIFGEILALARDQHISTYDASYLDLARRKGLSLATQDVQLKQAAKKFHVPLYAP